MPGFKVNRIQHTNLFNSALLNFQKKPAMDIEQLSGESGIESPLLENLNLMRFAIGAALCLGGNPLRPFI
jgi:hypothetical protein